MSVIAQRLWSEIESAPELVQAEVLDFILFVKAKGKAGCVALEPDQLYAGRVRRRGLRGRYAHRRVDAGGSATLGRERC